MDFNRQKLRSLVRAYIVGALVATMCVAVFIPDGLLNKEVFNQFMPLAALAVGYFFKNTGDSE
jgi:hypothetical protein